MRKMCIILIIISILISPVIGDDNSTKEPVTYRVFVDNQQGFNRIFDITLNKPVYSQNRTLNIYRGDTIIWINNIDRRLTIISEQKLWDNKSGHLAQEYKELNYTFTEPGIYNVYIKEYPTLKQKIIVGPIEQDSTSKNITNTTNTESNITTIKSNSTNITTVKQNSTYNASNITMKPANSIYSDIRSRFGTIILVTILLSIYVLSGRIKE